jgi:heat shock protein HslJ
MRRWSVVSVLVTGAALSLTGCGNGEATGVRATAVTSLPPATDTPTSPSSSPSASPSDSPSPSPSDSPSVSPSKPTSAPAAALAAAEAKWKNNALASYSFRYEPSCFCPRTKVVVTVVNGRVTSVKVAPGQDAAGAFVPAVADAPTVEKLFADLHRAYGGAKPAAAVQVTYDAERGFPTSAFIDWDANAADEESGYAISRLVAAPLVDVVGTWLPKKQNGAFVTFRSDGTYVGSDGCNGASGTWSLASGKLHVETGMHTEIGCDNQPVDEWIAAADSVAVGTDTITLVDGGKTTVLHRGNPPKS